MSAIVSPKTCFCLTKLTTAGSTSETRISVGLILGLAFDVTPSFPPNGIRAGRLWQGDTDLMTFAWRRRMPGCNIFKYGQFSTAAKLVRH